MTQPDIGPTPIACIPTSAPQYLSHPLLPTPAHSSFPQSKNRINKITPRRGPRPENRRIPQFTPQLHRPLAMILMLRVRWILRILRRLGNSGRVDIVGSLGVAGVDVGGWDATLLLHFLERRERSEYVCSLTVGKKKNGLE